MADERSDERATVSVGGAAGGRPDGSGATPDGVDPDVEAPPDRRARAGGLPDLRPDGGRGARDRRAGRRGARRRRRRRPRTPTPSGAPSTATASPSRSSTASRSGRGGSSRTTWSVPSRAGTCSDGTDARGRADPADRLVAGGAHLRHLHVACSGCPTAAAAPRSPRSAPSWPPRSRSWTAPAPTSPGRPGTPAGRVQTSPDPKYAPVVEQALPTVRGPGDVVGLALTLEDVLAQTLVRDVVDLSVARRAAHRRRARDGRRAAQGPAADPADAALHGARRAGRRAPGPGRAAPGGGHRRASPTSSSPRRRRRPPTEGAAAMTGRPGRPACPDAASSLGLGALSGAAALAACANTAPPGAPRPGGPRRPRPPRPPRPAPAYEGDAALIALGAALSGLAGDLLGPGREPARARAATGPCRAVVSAFLSGAAGPARGPRRGVEPAADERRAAPGRRLPAHRRARTARRLVAAVAPVDLLGLAADVTATVSATVTAIAGARHRDADGRARGGRRAGRRDARRDRGLPARTAAHRTGGPHRRSAGPGRADGLTPDGAGRRTGTAGYRPALLQGGVDGASRRADWQTGGHRRSTRHGAGPRRCGGWSSPRPAARGDFVRAFTSASVVLDPIQGRPRGARPRVREPRDGVVMQA